MVWERNITCASSFMASDLGFCTRELPNGSRNEGRGRSCKSPGQRPFLNSRTYKRSESQYTNCSSSFCFRGPKRLFPSWARGVVRCHRGAVTRHNTFGAEPFRGLSWTFAEAEASARPFSVVPCHRIRDKAQQKNRPSDLDFYALALCLVANTGPRHTRGHISPRTTPRTDAVSRPKNSL